MPAPKSSPPIPYQLPRDWILYDAKLIFRELVEAKAALLALKAIPHRRDWVERLQEIQLKMEVAGTSRIEGADFTELELDEAISPATATRDLHTRSQRQARAAVNTYRWIATIPDDRPIDPALILDIHARMVSGCDDDHCPPGRLRDAGQNVTFGVPKHRGCEGGKACQLAVAELAKAVNGSFRDHDPLLQAIALHYHFAAMHPFLDGNGRTARALEALLLQRAGLRDTAFIAMSNFYYEEKPRYLSVLSETRRQRHDLTGFFVFALAGLRLQCERLAREINLNVRKAVFRNMMFDLFSRLETPRKRVIAERQIEILKILLDADTRLDQLHKKVRHAYRKMKAPEAAFNRDMGSLLYLDAIHLPENEEGTSALVRINLDWPQQMTETDFLRRVKEFPKAKNTAFISFF